MPPDTERSIEPVAAPLHNTSTLVADNTGPPMATIAIEAVLEQLLSFVTVTV